MSIKLSKDTRLVTNEVIIRPLDHILGHLFNNCSRYTTLVQVGVTSLYRILQFYLF